MRAAIVDTPLASWPVLETTASGHAHELARALANAGGIVAAAGGDGTIGEVAAGLHHSPSALAVLPIGTGNDFARALGFGTSLSRAVDAIVNGQPQAVDLIRWKSGAQSGLGVNVAGCGFDAVVARRINEGYRYLRGTTAYLAAVLASLRTYQPSQLRLQVDSTIIDTSVMLCAVANATSYGGGMLVAPNAKMDDGLLDVVIVEGLSSAAFLAAFPRVFKGTHVSHPRVRVLQGRSVSVTAEPRLPVLVDGELIGDTPVLFKVVPGAVKVMKLGK